VITCSTEEFYFILAKLHERYKCIPYGSSKHPSEIAPTNGAAICLVYMNQ